MHTHTYQSLLLRTQAVLDCEQAEQAVKELNDSRSAGAAAAVADEDDIFGISISVDDAGMSREERMRLSLSSKPPSLSSNPALGVSVIGTTGSLRHLDNPMRLMHASSCSGGTEDVLSPEEIEALRAEEQSFANRVAHEMSRDQANEAFKPKGLTKKTMSFSRGGGRGGRGGRGGGRGARGGRGGRKSTSEHLQTEAAL